MAWCLLAPCLLGYTVLRRGWRRVVWLLVVCLLKRPLDRLPERAQWAVAIGLGVLIGIAGGVAVVWLMLPATGPAVTQRPPGAQRRRNRRRVHGLGHEVELVRALAARQLPLRQPKV